ncbi:MAG: phosphonopyruvate decarboxylase [Gemmatimonadetes bacterium]|nr:phosphonopyruvate decarboxylase [Gemmatimonadota bacterium]
MSDRVSSRLFVDTLTARGFGPYVGVPCSFLRPFIDYVIDRDDLSYVAATNEGEALALASGAQLAGRRPVVMLQNSGLGNLVNPLASLNYVFKIPVLIIVTLRGEPGKVDEPQHELMGRATGDLLRLLAVEHAWFPSRDGDVVPAVDAALDHMQRTGLPFAFVLRKNVVTEYAPQPRVPASPRAPGRLVAAVSSGPMLSRGEAIALIAEQAGEALIVATTGKTGRELFEYRDRPSHFYVVGSMGCASSLALGVARESDQPVVVLDGDGAALMRLEAMASIGDQAPPRLVHVILDNASYESTGGQATVSTSVRFPEIAAACGYASACSVTGAEPLRAALQRALGERGPHLIHVPVATSTDPSLGRPAVAPPDVARRFRDELARRSARR